MTAARELLRPVRAFSLAVIAAAVACAVTFSATAAKADPSVTDIEHQLDKQWAGLETTIEQYDKTAETLKRTKAAAAAASKKVGPLQARVDAAYAQVGLLSSAAYRGASLSAVNAFLSGGSPATMVEQLSMLDAISQTQQTEIDRLNKLKAPLDAQKNQLQQLLDQQQKMETDLAQKKVQINNALNTLQAQRKTAIIDRASRNGQRIDWVPDYVPGPPGRAVRFAYDQLGKPYVWNASGPDSYDCSGLTLAAWGQAGVSLGHYTGWQYDETRHISYSEAAQGDLVFFGSGTPHHVGIYLGNNLMIHAPTFGDVVKISNIYVMGEPPYFGRPYY